MELYFIVIAERGGDAALRIFGRGFAKTVFGNHQHRTRFRQLDGGAQSGDARADNQIITVDGVHAVYIDHGTPWRFSIDSSSFAKMEMCRHIK